MRVLIGVQAFLCEALIDVRACEAVKEVKGAEGEGGVC